MLGQIQGLHLVLHPIVQIHRTRVGFAIHLRPGHFRDGHARFAIHDLEAIIVDVAQAEFARGKGIARPVPGSHEIPHFIRPGQHAHDFPQVWEHRRVVQGKGQLRRRRPRVRQLNRQVVRIHHRPLGRLPHQPIRVVGNELIRGRYCQQQDGVRRFLPTARAAHLLPETGPRAREPALYHHLQLPDVDA